MITWNSRYMAKSLFRATRLNTSTGTAAIYFHLNCGTYQCLHSSISCAMNSLRLHYAQDATRLSWQNSCINRTCLNINNFMLTSDPIFREMPLEVSSQSTSPGSHLDTWLIKVMKNDHLENRSDGLAYFENPNWTKHKARTQAMGQMVRSVSLLCCILIHFLVICVIWIAAVSMI